ncbi:hypothetical protein TKK_0016394 [Trichogramma kaykai]
MNNNNLRSQRWAQSAFDVLSNKDMVFLSYESIGIQSCNDEINKYHVEVLNREEGKLLLYYYGACQDILTGVVAKVWRDLAQIGSIGFGPWLNVALQANVASRARHETGSLTLSQHYGVWRYCSRQAKSCRAKLAHGAKFAIH